MCCSNASELVIASCPESITLFCLTKKASFTKDFFKSLSFGNVRFPFSKYSNEEYISSEEVIKSRMPS